MIAALATTLFFALTPVFAHRSAKLLGSTHANFWRLVVATILLAAWAHLIGAGLGGGALDWFVAGGVIGFGVGGIAMFQALPRLGSNLANLIVQCGSAIVAAAVEWIWLGTRLSVTQLTFVALTLIGIAVGLKSSSAAGAIFRREAMQPAPDRGPESRRLPSLPRSPAVHDPRSGTANVVDRSGWTVGLLWGLLSAAGQGIGAVVSRKAFAVVASLHHHIDPGTAAYQRALGGLAVAGLAVALVAAFRPPLRSGTIATKSAHSTAIPWVLGNAVTGPILGVTCFQWALRTTPAGIVQPIVAAAPLLTIPFAAWLEGSRPRPLYYFGALLAAIGVTGLVLGH